MLELIQIGVYYGKFRIEEIIVIFIGFILFCFTQKKVTMKSTLIVLIILTVSILKIYINNYSYEKYVEQVLILGGVVLGYYYIFDYFGYKKIFKKYLDITVLFCWIGLFQFIIYFLFQINIIDKIDIFYKYHNITTIGPRFIRINPFSFESGNFAQTIIPAFIYYLEKINKSSFNKKRFILIAINMILTFSISGWIAIPIYIVYLLIKNKKMIQGILILVGLFFLQNIFVKNFEKRIFGIIDGFKNFNIKYIENLHPSAYAIMLNLYVALNNNNIILGTGLGTHPQSYNLIYRNRLYYLYGLNSHDAYSLFTRILSEFGIVGIFFFILFLLKFFNKKNAINISCLIGILSFFIRGGIYTRFGLIMFIYMYYFTRKKIRYRTLK